MNLCSRLNGLPVVVLINIMQILCGKGRKYGERPSEMGEAESELSRKLGRIIIMWGQMN